MKERILFLDIDGVLNSAEWLAAGHMTSIDRSAFAPHLCARLERVLVATGCKIVISSSWRVGHTLSEILGHLHARGAPSAHIIGATPTWRTAKFTSSIVGAYDRRGSEIQAWLDMNPPPPDGRAIAIVDDSDDMGPLSENLVRTSWARGIEDVHVDQLIAMLST